MTREIRSIFVRVRVVLYRESLKTARVRRERYRTTPDGIISYPFDIEKTTKKKCSVLYDNQSLTENLRLYTYIKHYLFIQTRFYSSCPSVQLYSAAFSLNYIPYTWSYC